MKKSEKVVYKLTVELIGPVDATPKRIRWVITYGLLTRVRELEQGFRRSKFPQMKGFSLRARKPKR